MTAEPDEVYNLAGQSSVGLSISEQPVGNTRPQCGRVGTINHI